MNWNQSTVSMCILKKKKEKRTISHQNNLVTLDDDEIHPN